MLPLSTIPKNIEYRIHNVNIWVTRPVGDNAPSSGELLSRGRVHGRNSEYLTNASTKQCWICSRDEFARLITDGTFIIAKK